MRTIKIKFKEEEGRFNPLMGSFEFKNFYYYWDDEDKKRYGCLVIKDGICYDNSTQLIKADCEAI